MKQNQLNNGWLSNTRSDVLSGMTVAIALIPEAIAFSILAGVSPMVGLYASFCIAVITALAGGRPGMISAATGAMALLVGSLVLNHGIEYLFAATILCGIFQILMGMLKLGRFITFLPQPVMTGFVNALAILIFMAQLVHFEGQGWVMYALVALTLVIIYTVPRFTKAVPSALVAIIIVSVLSIVLDLDVNRVGDMGEITSALPLFHLPQLPLTLDMLLTILPYSLSLAVVGLLESLMTATLIDDITGTPSDKNREAKGQGLANIVTGFFGGMAGCAMIGQSMVNMKSGGRTRLSTLVSGIFLLILILVLGDVVKQIPMGALVGVMIMVCVSTFEWSSLTSLARVPRADALVMIVTVVTVVATDNLSIGVLFGVLLSALSFAWKIASISLSVRTAGDTATYTVQGQLFFGTTSHFVHEFNYEADPEQIVIDFTQSHVWDQSAAGAIAKTISRYGALGKKVTITGLNEQSTELIDRIGLGLSGGHA
ncbi:MULTISPECIES: SulP family inorganic anion transporter [unclassified Paenibacillus]|uniref:SulP family inorganic anion transporter n=1 Tax=unclassified Paenibacillus TaxID=185978 RepID=UPI002405ABE0|nr:MULTISPECIES: SulP family inorganic anion transporter [unclassified Paenibacillus]MDF9843099.1 SulP family sulfate permease [Paenibacillus sp. PastF-2]MDF9849689.1 SulP family sulfate permease [Paenibacillus sp. PastM-2]MDF9856393.1 SulP family sulfate permease [Paenibacillus sp. PastF-1]MDH6481665.1 SulP family sulfate permease [Paenibacillus sp. PastH-2]MDH6508946.1 SulP family sulfate permease [Paenibacillus sp. PastM-3]